MKKMIKLVACATAFGVLAGGAFQGVNYATGALTAQESQVSESQDTAKIATTNVVSTAASTGTSDVTTVAEQVLPSIVAIDVTAQTTTGYSMFGQQQQQETKGSGSGIIIAEKNNKMYIATNNHVIEGATSVTITFNNKKTAKATVKGTDSSKDLAIVEVDMSSLSSETLSSVKIAAIGDSTKTKVGEQAIANALGYGTSVTVGYISAKDREIDSEDSSSVKLLQTDAAINPGNSGGALVNSKGEVIGINSSKFASEEVEGMGFAIPMATAESILEELMNQKTVDASEQAYLGITGRDITSEYVKAYGLPEGIYVSEVTSGSPAEKAGIRSGYIITGINGKEVKTLTDLQEKLSQCKAGEKGTITVKINSEGSYKEKTIQVTFGKKPSSNS